MKRLFAAVGLILCLAGGSASANIIFTFSGVTFDDGGTLTGTFTTDDALTTLLGYDVTTSAGIDIGFHYTSGSSDSSSTSLPFILVFNTPPADDHLLEVTFSGGLTTSGAPLTIDPFSSFEQGINGARRDIATGSVVVQTVPEPSTIALFGIGVLVLALLLYLRRRPND